MKLKYLLAASVVSLSAAAILPAPAFAQQITTGIEGTVTDADGNPLSGATVTITDTRTGASREITTGSTGTFAATGLVTGGPYTVSANAAGSDFTAPPVSPNLVAPSASSSRVASARDCASSGPWNR